MRSHAPAKADDTQKNRISQPASGQARAEAFFIDNRPEAVVQRQLKEMLNASPGVRRQKATMEMVQAGHALQMRRSLAERVEQQGIQLQSGGGEISFHQAALQGTSGAPSTLPYLDTIQKSFGRHDVSSIAAHSDDRAARAASAMGAEAFAMGRHVAFKGSPDLHTAAHEAAHVVQQRAGLHLKGGVGEAGDRHERHADAVADLVVQGKSAEAYLDQYGGAPADAGAAPIQHKGAKPLMDGLKPALPWVYEKIGDALGGYDPHLKPLFAKINEYDRSTDGRPAQQLQQINAMILDLQNWLQANLQNLAPDDIENHQRLLEVLGTEREIVNRQARRLDRFTADNDAPYEQMTAEGMLWSHPDYEHNTKAIGHTGKAYFDELSARNRALMADEAEVDNLKDAEWFKSFVARAEQVLSHSVLNHYTTSIRAQAMVNGGMKSKTMLEKTNATFKHNTSVYDDIGLANSGFLFFFIESPNAAHRETRFAQGDDNARPARISIPIEESGLLDHGWIMLSDFAQREYPDIMTNDANDAHTSWLPTRKADEEKKPKNKGFTHKVKHFEYGLGQLTDQDLEAMEVEPDGNRRNAISVVSPQVRGDKNSMQVYSGPQGTHKVPDRLLQNVLVGPDIIPGLANRTALEVARIAAVNPTLAEGLKELDGDKLMLFMLKDLFRPQAMIPNSLDIQQQWVQVDV